MVDFDPQTVGGLGLLVLNRVGFTSGRGRYPFFSIANCGFRNAVFLKSKFQNLQPLLSKAGAKVALFHF
jgi:hypothetical protein